MDTMNIEKLPGEFKDLLNWPNDFRFYTRKGRQK